MVKEGDRDEKYGKKESEKCVKNESDDNDGEGVLQEEKKIDDEE